MNKFLFTDGINGVREAASLEELQKAIAGISDRSSVRIWVFDTSEWISYDRFQKHYIPQGNLSPGIPVPKAGKSYKLVRQFTLVLVFIAAGFLVVNFTKVKWSEAKAVTIRAARPNNVPLMNIDSLVSEIEWQRGKPVDRHTKNNLRMRNSWPDLILLKVNAQVRENGTEKKFSDVTISIDNSTTLTVDEAEVRVTSWRNGRKIKAENASFKSITYGRPAEYVLNANFQGDSLSVEFSEIKAKSFNFCFSSGVKNNSGNYNDRWFCFDK